MELPKDIKELLQAHEMASVSDFVQDDETLYLQETDLDLFDIQNISQNFNGWGMSAIEEHIISKLKDFL